MPENFFPLFATLPKGLEDIAVVELNQLGMKEVKPTRSGVHFQADLKGLYQACLWSRLANRILLQLGSFPAADGDQLYQAALSLPLEEHLDLDGTLLVDFVGTSREINHSRFGAQRVKDGIMDRYSQRTGVRPSVDFDQPDLVVVAFLEQDQVHFSLDLSGGSLHKRGYREQGVQAPMKENLAAALLYKMDWPKLAAQGASFADPFCGSGTLCIEAALMAMDSAPGLLRPRFGFEGWLQHEPSLWTLVLDEAEEREEQGLAKLPKIFGFDHDRMAVKAAMANLERAGLAGLVHFEKRELEDFSLPKVAQKGGLVLTNPPYGERLGHALELIPLYRQLGQQMQQEFPGWRLGVLTSDEELAFRLGLKADKKNFFYNGAIECRLYQFQVPEVPQEKRQAPGEGVEAFVNRIKKNLKKMHSWLKRDKVRCYRLYDADLPDYNLAIDRYGEHLMVQEYKAPDEIDPKKAQKRLYDALEVLPELLGVERQFIHLKVRETQKGSNQYEKQAERGRNLQVEEGGLKFLVNMTDYLDVGLFLDHRPTRAMIQRMAEGKDFLNLFCYTGSVTVYAAAGGAKSTTSVDMSQTYLDWAKRNMDLNHFGGRAHQQVRADCTAWMKQAQGQWDLIFLDPPTFSNSKAMERPLDVDKDHPFLIRRAMDLLRPDGVLVFSNNFRKFKMEEHLKEFYQIEDITPRTIPPDFARNPKIHNCWLIRHK